MLESIATVVIVLLASIWFIRWFRGKAKGERGCTCDGSCGKKDCCFRTKA